MGEHEVKNWKEFVTAGKSIFTVVNTKTGGRFTFKVTRRKGHHVGTFRFVSVLTGPDNNSHYTYIGCLFGDAFKLTPKSRMGEDAPAVQAFVWLNKIRTSPHDLPPAAKFYHEDRCGRCGKRLTVPESIDQGYGPECIHFVRR